MLLEKEHKDYLETENRKLMIGIPLRNDRESFGAMYFSLVSSTRAYDKIVIIESESTDGSRELCEQFKKTNPKLEVIHTPKEGPLKAYNRLFKLAKERKCDLFLTQTDVLFPVLYKRDWLGIMKDIAKNETIGAITSINGGGVSGPTYIDGFEWLGGWCTYYPYRTIEKVGGYDEDFPNGYGVDIEHTYRIYQSGLNILKLNYWVDHHMMNAREHDNHPDVEKHKKACQIYFRKKHKLGEFKNE